MYTLMNMLIMLQFSLSIFWHLKKRLVIPLSQVFNSQVLNHGSGFLSLPSFEGQPCDVGIAPRYGAVRQPVARLPRVLGDSSDAVGGDVPRADQQRFDLFQCSLERLGNCWAVARSSKTHAANGTIPGTKRGKLGESSCGIEGAMLS